MPMYISRARTTSYLRHRSKPFWDASDLVLLAFVERMKFREPPPVDRSIGRICESRNET